MLRWLVAITALTLLACSPEMPPAHADSKVKEDRSQPFRHRRSRLVAGLGSPRHTAGDVIATTGAATVIEGKFAYSKASKDLEDEHILFEVEKPGGWAPLGRALTDDDGRARIEIAARHLPAAGSARCRMTVEGDGTSTEARVWVLPRKAPVAIFDIDGTLTAGNREIIKRAVWGSSVKVRPGASSVASHWGGKKVQPIYLTGRPYMFNDDTRRWLAEHGFPAGPLLTPAKLRRALPTSAGVGAFKKRELERLIDGHELRITVAYGNASTDVCAFAQAGIEPSVTYIFDDDLEACEGFAAPHGISDFRAHLRALKP